MIDVVLCVLAAAAGAWSVRWALHVPEEEEPLSEAALDFLAAQLLDDQVTLPVSAAERAADAYGGAQARVRFFEQRPYRVEVRGTALYRVYEDGVWEYVGPALRHGYVTGLDG